MKEYELNPNKCLNCGKPFSYKERDKTFCNKSCAASYNNKQRTKEVYEKVWLAGKYFINPNNKIPDFVRKYLYERSEYKCEKCGFEGYNPVTGNSILQIHHIDGDASNNFENNL